MICFNCQIRSLAQGTKLYGFFYIKINLSSTVAYYFGGGQTGVLDRPYSGDRAF